MMLMKSVKNKSSKYRIGIMIIIVVTVIIIMVVIANYNLSLTCKSRRMRWVGHVVRMEEGRNIYRALVGRPEGKRPLGRPRRRWEDNIKMDLSDRWGKLNSAGSR
jgi:hypothetical protein